jgi:hypothetical protein
MESESGLFLLCNPIDQARRIQQRRHFVQGLLDIQGNLQALLMKSGARARIRGTANASGVFKPATDFGQIKSRHMFSDFSVHRFSSSKAANMDAPNSAEVERNQSNLVARLGANSGCFF